MTDTEKLQSKVEGGAKTYGPWGGTGGIMFDDGIYTGIRQINLSRSVGIVSIKVCYDFRGQAVWGSKHGGTGGFKHDKVREFETFLGLLKLNYTSYFTGLNVVTCRLYLTTHQRF